jgi:aryl-alcohol dehydrogenase-like predicted oxidoreductase
VRGRGEHEAGPVSRSLAEQFGALAELRQEGLVKHLGVSTVTPDQIDEARSIAPVVCVQNAYNVAHRGDDDLVDTLAAQGVAYVPYFPLGGFSPLQSGVLTSVSSRLGTSPTAVALAWLLQRSPNILLIPGTSSVGHLRENVAAASVVLSPDDVRLLDGIARA